MAQPDNGIIAIVIGRTTALDTITIDTWLMSCRVLGRRVEELVLATVAQAAKKAGATRLVGTYLPTKKNSLVAEHFAKLGFEKLSELADGGTTWVLALDQYTTPDFPMQVIYTDGLNPVADVTIDSTPHSSVSTW